MSQYVTVERESDKIVLRGWIGSQTPALCKSVPGAKFDPEAKVWRYPLDYGTCKQLREAFGQHLKIGSKLRAWAIDARDAQAALAEIASASSAELRNVPRLAPRMAEAMGNRTYQQVGAAFGARLGSFGLFDQPGLGKTITALGALVEANGVGGRYLVLCPKVAVLSVWKAEIEQWLGDAAKVWALSGDRAAREETLADFDVVTGDGVTKRSHFVIGNIEMARIAPGYKANKDGKVSMYFPLTRGTSVKPAKGRTPAKTVEHGPEYPELFTLEWDAVIVDESHRALVRSGGTPTQQRAGMTALRAKRRIALSGTPMRGKPEQLWGTLNWLRPDVYTAYWRWVERYFSLTSNGFSNYVLAGYRPGGEERLAADLRSVSLRRTKAEVLAELPPKQYAGSYLIPGDPNSPHGVWLTMEPKQAKLYKDFEREAAVVVEGGEVTSVGILAENTRKKQLAGAAFKVENGKVTPTLPSAKFDWLVQKLDELGILEGEGTSKIVVASQFTSLLKVITSELTALGVKVSLLTGETPEKTRQAIVSDFQTTGDVRVFLLNTKAGGVAVTLDAADDLVLLDETYIPDDQEQVEDRIHRTSRIHNVTIHRLRCLDTIEEEIAWLTAAREDVMQYLLDGARGVEAAKAIYAAKAAA